jgi:hypothetical protein
MSQKEQEPMEMLTKIWSSIFFLSWIHKRIDIKIRHFLKFYKFTLQPSVSSSSCTFQIGNLFMYA